MNPLKLYLLRAVHDWAVDSGFTPHVLADANAAGVMVPPGYVDKGRIVLNTHPRAVNHLEFAGDALRFSARFGAQSVRIEIPYAAVLAIYARENGQGITFPPETPDEVQQQGEKETGHDDNPPEGKPPGKGPGLRIVK
jgi:stringent starvation protein B